MTDRATPYRAPDTRDHEHELAELREWCRSQSVRTFMRDAAWASCAMGPLWVDFRYDDRWLQRVESDLRALAA